MADPASMRIGILLDHPSPHMTALLDALCAQEGCAAHVTYLDRASPGRNWGAPVAGLPHRFVRGFNWPGGVRLNPGICHILKTTKVDVWVLYTCYTSPTTLLAAWWLRRHGIPWVYVNEPPQPRDALLTSFRQPIVSFVLKRAWGVAGTGRRAEEMYRDILPDTKLTESVPYYIDLDSFYSIPPIAPLADHEPVYFVSSCQMIARKGLDVLLHACKLLPNDGWMLTLAGDGPLRANLERDFAQRWDQSQVRFIGQVPYEDRASVFAGKHVFVFPSRWDGWGMVVPEALAAGLPVISSDAVISAHEFINNGENGFITPSGNAQAFAKRMAFFIENRSAIPRMGLAARQSLESYRPDIGGRKLVTFLQALDGRNRTKRNGDQVCYANLVEPHAWERLTLAPNVSGRLRLTARQTTKNLFISTALKVKPKKKPHGDRILVYHLVLPEDRKRFEEHLKFLSDHFTLCTVAELLTDRNWHTEADRYRAAISFDDGFRILMADCLEIFQKHRVRATYYVPTGFVQLSTSPELAAQYSLRAHHYNLPLEPMQKEDLRLLTDLGHEVGSHGQSHIKLSFLSQQAAHRELTLSMRQIEEWTGSSPAGFAYPYGDLSSSLGQPAEWVRGAGYRYAVTLRRGPITTQTDRFQIPRDHVEGNWRLSDLRYFLFS
jgi:glycosyltransferase involved in cell wall biosynthesis/peptidoglycan/xylan/chitin deacetylase (PgdA/CDA1 family)